MTFFLLYIFDFFGTFKCAALLSLFPPSKKQALCFPKQTSFFVQHHHHNNNNTNNNKPSYKSLKPFWGEPPLTTKPNIFDPTQPQPAALRPPLVEDKAILRQPRHHRESMSYVCPQYPSSEDVEDSGCQYNILVDAMFSGVVFFCQQKDWEIRET